MPAPVSDQNPTAPAPPPLLPKVVVVLASDVTPDPQPDNDPVAPVNLLLEKDSVSKSNGPTPAVDGVQEEVMAVISPDGRPPNRELRVLQWKWVLIAGGILLTCAAVVVAMSNMAWPTVLFAGVIVLVLVGAAIPTWGAGLLRGGEERRARVSALEQKEHDRPV